VASRIIKPGTVRAADVQRFLFCQNPPETREIEPLQWPELPSAQSAAPAVALPEATRPAADIAQLEKAAYENGFRKGQEAGIVLTQEKVEAAIRKYGEAIDQIGRVKASLYLQVEREVAKLAIEVAKKIVHREIEVDREIIQTLVHVALTHVSEKSPVRIHLHPDDYSYLLEQTAELSQTEGRNVSLLSDRSIERGGCLIETESGDIDARLEEKFREVENAFFEGAK
jgi:flagellar assembly protein FliH